MIIKNNKKKNSKIISFINQSSNNMYIISKSWKEIRAIFLDSTEVILPRERWTNFVAIIPCPTD